MSWSQKRNIYGMFKMNIEFRPFSSSDCPGCPLKKCRSCIRCWTVYMWRRCDVSDGSTNIRLRRINLVFVFIFCGFVSHHPGQMMVGVLIVVSIKNNLNSFTWIVLGKYCDSCSVPSCRQHTGNHSYLELALPVGVTHWCALSGMSQ